MSPRGLERDGSSANRKHDVPSATSDFPSATSNPNDGDGCACGDVDGSPPPESPPLFQVRCSSCDSNEEGRQDTCQDAAATHCGLHLRVTSPNHRARPVTGFADGRMVGGMPCGPYCAVALFFAELLAARRRLTALFAEG